MKSKALEYYVGKVCTIFTTPINQAYLSYKEQIFSYFIGRVESVDHIGIQITNSLGRKNFYFFPNILAICEEEALDPENPEHAKIIKEMDEEAKRAALEAAQAPPVPEQPQQRLPMPPTPQQPSEPSSPFVDVQSFQALAKRAKQTFDGKKK